MKMPANGEIPGGDSISPIGKIRDSIALQLKR